MPVYEFYCRDCHTVFNFLSRRVVSDPRPTCPRCSRSGLERQVSPFAFSRGVEEPEGMPPLEDERLEKAMMALAGEMESTDENDPQAMARLMRRLSESTGMNLGEGFEEAMRRLEAGEDPERVEEEMGDLFGNDSPLSVGEGVKGLRRKFTAPVRDETLYPLEP